MKYFVKQVNKKLFLCSRDIQIGDKWYYEWNNGLEEQEEPADLDTAESVREHPEIGFKVIGEISPDTIWVKEGDEFDKKELCAYSQAGFNSGSQTHEMDFKEKDFSKANNPRMPLLYVGILGPCGHFH